MADVAFVKKIVGDCNIVHAAAGLDVVVLSVAVAESTPVYKHKVLHSHDVLHAWYRCVV
jgi:hypothetical protein